VIRGDGNLGIGDTDPAAPLTVGAGDAFQVDSLGAVMPAVYSGVMNGDSGIDFGTYSNIWTATEADSEFFLINTGTTDVVVRTDGNVGIGETDPSNLFVVGSGNDFQIDSSGNIVSIRTVSYSWPSTQGVADTVLQNDGSGNLTWVNQSNLMPRYDQIADAGTHSGLDFTTFTNVWTSAAGDSEFFLINTGTIDVAIRGDGNVGIGETDPADIFVVGAGSQFQVASDGSTIISGNLTVDDEIIGLNYDKLDDAENNAGIDFATFSNTWTVGAIGGTFFKIDQTGNASGGDVMEIAGDDTDLTALLRLDNEGAVTIADALLIEGSDGSAVITDAIDASDNEIVNALNIGSNNIITGATTISSSELDVLDAGVDYDEIDDAAANASIAFSTFTNVWTSTTTASDFFTIMANENFGDISLMTIEQTTGNQTDGELLMLNAVDANVDALIVASGNVGIGDTDPVEVFVVGDGDDFQIDATGNIVSIRTVSYSWPSTQGVADTVLQNDGSGNLTWVNQSNLPRISKRSKIESTMCTWVSDIVIGRH